jgi:hypothetical protein
MFSVWGRFAVVLVVDDSSVVVERLAGIIGRVPSGKGVTPVVTPTVLLYMAFYQRKRARNGHSIESHSFRSLKLTEIVDTSGLRPYGDAMSTTAQHRNLLCLAG